MQRSVSGRTLGQYCQATVDFLQDSTYADSALTANRLGDILDSIDYYEDLYRQEASSAELAFYDLVTYEIQDTSYAADAQGIDTTLVLRLSAVEEQILSSSMPDSNKIIPLVYVAVAKHSAAYWTSVHFASIEGFVGSQQSLSKTMTPFRPPHIITLYQIWRHLTPAQRESVIEFTQEDARAAALVAAGIAVARGFGIPVSPREGAALIVGGGIIGSIDKATE
jgi:hypothetical protein